MAGRRARPTRLVPEHAHTKGSSRAPVTVVEFGDYQCPACAVFAREVQPLLKAELIDNGVVRFAYRHLPVLGRESLRAAQASECAASQGKFWDYHKVLYQWQGRANVGDFSDELLTQLALGVRLNPHEYRSCMQLDEAKSIIDQDLLQAASLGITGALAVFVNGVRVEPPPTTSSYGCTSPAPRWPGSA